MIVRRPFLSRDSELAAERPVTHMEVQPMSEAHGEPGPDTAEIRFRVRYAETDAMGVVHHSRYLPWLEMGRTEILRSRDYSYRQLEQAGVLLAVIEVRVRYRAPAVYDDSILLRTRLVEFG